MLYNHLLLLVFFRSSEWLQKTIPRNRMKSSRAIGSMGILISTVTV